jgi:hypothetical protein
MFISNGLGKITIILPKNVVDQNVGFACKIMG